MSILVEKRTELISQFGRSIHDTGSSEVQIAFLTVRISYLQDHFSKHKKDYHSKRGLIHMVSRRRKLLDYLKSRDIGRYISLIKKLGLRR